MLSLADATSLLADATASADLAPLARALGFHAPLLALDEHARTRLSLPPGTIALVARGPGVLRLLALHGTGATSARELITAAARRLDATGPHLRWLVAAREPSGALTLAAWQRTASLRISASTLGRVPAPSDVETLCALTGAGAVPLDIERHLRWLDVLGREGISRRFFRALSASIATCTASLAPAMSPAAATDAHHIALLTVSRLLFLSFLEAKGWLAGDFCFLTNGFAQCMATGGGYHRRALQPLFFGTLNTPVARRAPRARAFGPVPFLNGGLFSRSPVERLHRHLTISDDALGALFGDLLVRYRFTPVEAASAWSETAVDPEILGRTFESLMASADRKRYGVHYTPRPFVERVTDATVAATLDAPDADVARRALHGEPVGNAERSRTLTAVKRLRLLDPACGSGAFLVYALEHLTRLRIALGEHDRPSDVARAVVQSSLFGVDISPIAVWLCQLRLWLATVADAAEHDPLRVRPLPNLDRQIRIGDSLAGPPMPLEHAQMHADVRASTHTTGDAARLRRRYVAATGARKVTLARALDRVERQRALQTLDHSLERVRSRRRELLSAARSTDLFRARHALSREHRMQLLALRAERRSLRRDRTLLSRGGALPFAFASHFPEVADAQGFDAVVGNPPWVRTHELSPKERERHRTAFRVARTGWRDGAQKSGAPGFGMQTDLAALFLERALQLVRPHGTVGYLVPAKLWRSLAGGGVRTLLHDAAQLLLLEDHSHAPASFDAATYPSVLVARRTVPTASHDSDPELEASLTTPGGTTRWRTSLATLAFDSSPGAPWLVVPPALRHAFDLLRDAGVPLATTPLGRPWLGVKSGCNQAFLVAPDDNSADVEPALLRPVLRGESVRMWSTPAGPERIIWTHGDSGEPLETLPAATRRWLSRFRHRLERRADARGVHRWWSLFRTEGADSSTARVAWNDIGRRPRATVIAPGDAIVPLNTCYIVRVRELEDALALAALLNSRIAAGWLSTLAEPARGGHFRFLGWTVGALPIPRHWSTARALLAPAATRALDGHTPTDDALDDLVRQAYDLTWPDVQPLIEACTP